MERQRLRGVVKKLAGGSQKARRARILLEADADGPAWTDAEIAKAVGCRVQTVENVRERLVTRGFEETLEGKQRAEPPTPKILDGAAEAKLIALRLGPPPVGHAQWSLRLLAEQSVALEIAPALSHETARRTLKKTACRAARSPIG